MTTPGQGSTNANATSFGWPSPTEHPAHVAVGIVHVMMDVIYPWFFGVTMRTPPGERPGLRAGSASREVVAQSLEQALGAFLTARPVGPELVEEDAVLDVCEPGALVYGLEL